MENAVPRTQVVSKNEYEVLAEFRYTLRKFLRFSEAAANELGLTPQQHQALLAIKGFPGRDQITIGELAERLQIRHHSAVGLADRLEAENLIERSPSAGDRRKVYISLTSHGLALIHKLSALHHDELLRLVPQLRLLMARVSKLSGGEDRPHN